jgi:hypothetical protein
MKNITFLLLFLLCSCGQNSDGDVQSTDGSSLYSTIITNGDLTFYINETYQYGYGNITSSVVNNSKTYKYNFDYELQLWQNGILLDSTGPCYIYELYPGQSQRGGGLNTRYTINDQTFKIVMTNSFVLSSVNN